MTTANLLAEARHAAGMSQDELARRAHTSRPTLSAYEHGRKWPSLETAARLLAESGLELTVQPLVTFTDQATTRRRTVAVPTVLWRLPLDRAFATVVLPVHLNWSDPGRRFDLRDRSQRARVYEIVLREGTPDDVLAYLDGALLIDLWDDLVIPRDIRAVWAPLIKETRMAAA